MFGEHRLPNQERRPSARRGSVTGRACRAQRTMFGEHRLPNQERWSSARRGSETAPAMAIGFCGVITFTTRDRMVHHAWLTPAALDARTRIVANVRLRFARAIRFTTTAGLRQPLLVHDAGSLKNNDISGAQTHVLQERRASARRAPGMRALSGESRARFGGWRIHNQERRASARRGSANAPANTGRLLPNEDARMPRAAYVPRSCVGVRMSAGEIAIFAMHKCTSAAAAGVSPPCFGNRAGKHRAFVAERGCSHATGG
jgi:hypothetical protein